MLMSEPGISWGLLGDLYVVMGEKVDGQNYALRFHYKPFIRWVWGGGLFMMLGGGCVLWSKFRKQNKPDSVAKSDKTEVAS